MPEIHNEELEKYAAEDIKPAQLDRENLAKDIALCELEVRRYLSGKFKGDNAKHRQDIDDMTQETLVNATKFADDFEGKEQRQLLNWVIAIARNVAKGYLRQEQKGRTISETDLPNSLSSLENLPAASSGGEADMLKKIETSERHQALENAIRRLNPLHQKVLRLSLEGHANEQIAEMVGRTVKEIKNDLYRARKKIADIMGNKDFHLNKPQEVQPRETKEAA